MSVNMNVIKVSPVGGRSGTVWDEKGKSEIAKIFVSDNGQSICSLQFVYVETDHFVSSNLHGTAELSKNFTTVSLDYPSEFLTLISGTFSAGYLRTITFSTNKGSYGPYGKNPSQYMDQFNFQMGNDRMFAGFRGTKYGNSIESIGIYVKTITSSMIAPRCSRITNTPQVMIKREED
ncbi:inactive protein RESTRICTED TEV MOVEMENT 1-like [Lycium barbarum]|uniref:inactive protein RESTRICTED TEV MOVEMENT 1-like n=1 Tax=Lycium barbarum TaxID=112863 RepID=UPI00293E14CE|nr:inactive protein RESTRICTED TEV MOVEMENT 1-like [Lycium barbarum]